MKSLNTGSNVKVVITSLQDVHLYNLDVVVDVLLKLSFVLKHVIGIFDLSKEFVLDLENTFGYKIQNMLVWTY